MYHVNSRTVHSMICLLLFHIPEFLMSYSYPRRNQIFLLPNVFRRMKLDMSTALVVVVAELFLFLFFIILLLLFEFERIETGA